MGGEGLLQGQIDRRGQGFRECLGGRRFILELEQGRVGRRQPFPCVELVEEEGDRSDIAEFGEWFELGEVKSLDPAFDMKALELVKGADARVGVLEVAQEALHGGALGLKGFGTAQWRELLEVAFEGLLEGFMHGV